jgi:hypothetical protein
VQDGNAGFSEVSPVLAGAARAKADKVMAAAWSAKFDENLSGSARWNAADVVGEQNAEEPNGAAVRFVLTTKALGPGSAARRLLSRIRASEARILVVKVVAAACEARSRCRWEAARARAESTVAALAAAKGRGEGGDGKMEQGEGRRVGDAGEPGDAVGAAEAAEEEGEGV